MGRAFEKYPKSYETPLAALRKLANDPITQGGIMTPPIQAPELDLAAVLDTDAAYDPLAFIEGEDTED